jgi:hypothetical protein
MVAGSLAVVSGVVLALVFGVTMAMRTAYAGTRTTAITPTATEVSKRGRPKPPSRFLNEAATEVAAALGCAIERARGVGTDWLAAPGGLALYATRLHRPVVGNDRLLPKCLAKASASSGLANQNTTKSLSLQRREYVSGVTDSEVTPHACYVSRPS